MMMMTIGSLLFHFRSSAHKQLISIAVAVVVVRITFVSSSKHLRIGWFDKRQVCVDLMGWDLNVSAQP